MWSRREKSRKWSRAARSSTRTSWHRRPHRRSSHRKHWSEAYWLLFRAWLRSIWMPDWMSCSSDRRTSQKLKEKVVGNTMLPWQHNTFPWLDTFYSSQQVHMKSTCHDFEDDEQAGTTVTTFIFYLVDEGDKESGRTSQKVQHDKTPRIVLRPVYLLLLCIFVDALNNVRNREHNGDLVAGNQYNGNDVNCRGCPHQFARQVEVRQALSTIEFQQIQHKLKLWVGRSRTNISRRSWGCSTTHQP